MNNIMTKLVLGSTSPFRREILQRLGLPFDTAAPNVDEAQLPDESPQELVKRLSVAKAQAVASQFPDALIIGSDQVAVIDDDILGKPGNHDRAVEQLRRASGRSVNFYTGLCLYNSRTKQHQLDVVSFEVVFRKLTDRQIERYLQREQPYNCAGSFKSEALGITLFEAMRGDDPTALIGLPLIRLTSMLVEEGVALP